MNKVLKNTEYVIKLLKDMPDLRDMFIRGDVFAVVYEITTNSGKVYDVVGIDLQEKGTYNEEEFIYKTNKLLNTLKKYKMFDINKTTIH